MYTKQFKHFKRIVALFMVVSFIFTTSFSNSTLADTSYNSGLIGQELLEELRSMGLGQLDFEQIDPPAQTTPPALDIAPGGDADIPTQPGHDNAEQDEQPSDQIQGDQTPGDEEGEQPEGEAPGTEQPGDEVIQTDEPTIGEEISPVMINHVRTMLYAQPAPPVEEGRLESSDIEESQPEQGDSQTPPSDSIPEGDGEDTQPDLSSNSKPDDEVDVTTPGAIQIPNNPILTQREHLREYVQGLTGKQIVSLDEFYVTEEEWLDLYSLLTEEQYQDVIEARKPECDYLQASPLIREKVAKREENTFASTNRVKPIDGLEMSKSSAINPETGQTTITMEAYTSGTYTTESIGADIVLVLDQSGSMRDPFEKKGGKSKLNVLKEKVENFINEATDTNLNHRIAIVGFGSGDMDGGNPDYENTELLVGSEEHKYGSISDQAYKLAFQKVTDSNGTNNLRASVNKLAASGATRSDLGLEIARKIFEQNSNIEIVNGVEYVRPRVVIMFTDGEPNNLNGFDRKIAASAVNEAKELKQAYKATVYAIGVIPGSNVSDTSSDVNRYMHGVSSNYPNASGVKGNWRWEIDLGTGNNKAGYYLTATTADGLGGIFGSILESIIRPDVTASAVIKDYVSKYFKFPEGSSDVRLSIYDATGSDEEVEWSGPREAQDVTVEYYYDKDTASDSTSKVVGIGVTGFDFWNNYVRKVDGQWKGSKIVIQFDVEPIDGFVGGNSVPTNTADSGIYEDGKGVGGTLGHFDVPTVDVPIQYDFTPYDQKVYITNQVEDLTTLLTKAPSEGVEYQIGEGNYKLGSPFNDFVDITYNVKQSAQDITNTYTVEHTSSKGTWEQETKVPYLPIDDNYASKHDYEIGCSIKPIFEGNCVEKPIINKTASVYVYTPELTYKDEEIYLGENAQEEVIEKLSPIPTWVCKGNGEIGSIEGTAPTLQYSYLNQLQQSIGDWWLEENTPIDVKVAVSKENTESIDITKYTTIYNGDKVTEGTDFTINVKTCELVINKVGEGIQENENFIFDVIRTNGTEGEPSKFQEKYGKAQVVIKGTGEVTLIGLPIGSYTVQEDEDWSWRYEATQSPDGSIILSRNTPEGKVTITNTRKNNKWLTDEQIETNTFTVKAPKLPLFPQF